MGKDISAERLQRMVSIVQEKVELWWSHFMGDVFPLLVPRRTMMREFVNLNIADIVLLKYTAKYSKDRFRLARILDLHPDVHGRVRTVTIGVRNNYRGARERRDVNTAGLVTMRVPVQRLILILPASEQPEELVRELEERARRVDAAPQEMDDGWQMEGVMCTESWEEPMEQRQRGDKTLLAFESH